MRALIAVAAAVTAGVLGAAVLAPVAATGAGTRSGAAASAGEQADNSLLLLLDASGSMREGAGGGRTRIQAAKSALRDLVAELPASSDVGLRVYGATKDTGCDDTTLVAPVRPLDRAGLRRAIDRFQPRGDTPIGASLRAAAKDLRDAPGRRTVVLVSDGEDTCAPPEPCEVAEELAAQGLDLRVEAIGFQVGAAARRQLACIAKATGGSYFDAPDAGALTAQLQALSLRAFRPFRPTGAPVEGAADAAAAPELTPGAWVDDLAPGESKFYRLDVPDGAVPVVNGALIAGATQPRLASPENFLVVLTDESGQECARGSASQVSRSFTAGATATGPRAEAGGSSPCASPGPRLLRVERQFDGGEGSNTVELLYSRIGAPDEGAEPAPQVQPGPRGGTTSDPTAVRGGTSYGDAPFLGTGSWTDTVRTSETLYYRVPVGWGQALRATATFTRASGSKLQPLVEVHDALRVDPGNRRVVQLTSSSPREARVETTPVRGPESVGDPVTPFRIAGDEYVVVNGSELLGSDRKASARLRLDLEVIGEQVEGPRLTVVGTEESSSPSPTGSSGEATTTAPDQGSGAGDAEAGGNGTVLAVVAAVLVLAGAAVAVATRRGGRGRRGDGPSA